MLLMAQSQRSRTQNSKRRDLGTAGRLRADETGPLPALKGTASEMELEATEQQAMIG